MDTAAPTGTPPARQVQAAMDLARQGRLAEAIEIMSAVLAEDGRDPAWHRLHGNLLAAAGRHGQAIAAFGRGSALSAADPESVFNLAVCLSETGDRNGALEAYDRCLSLRRDWAAVRFNRANVLARAGRTAEARSAYGALLERRPDHAPARVNLAALLRRGGEAPAAVRLLTEALAGRPRHPELLDALGLALLDTGDTPKAARAFAAGAAAAPEQARAHYHLGLARSRLGDAAGAMAAYGRALVLNPAMVPAAINLAALFTAAGRHGEAAAVLDRTGARCPGDVDLRIHLGNALERAGDGAGAEAVLESALALSPENPAVLTNLGVVMNARGDHRQARVCFAKALSLDGGFAEARFNHGQLALLMGDFETGWPDYESRLEKPDWKHIYPYRRDLPRWTGAPLAGRRLYVHDEQGFGDTLQFVRYLPMVKALGGTVILETRRPLVRLLATAPGVDAVVARPAACQPVAADLEISLMSLPALFATRAETIPATVPYITAPPALSERWAGALAGPGLAVALVWAGNPGHQNDRRRSLPPALLKPLGKVPGLRLFSLQKGPGSEARAGVPGLAGVVDLGPELADFADTAGCLAHMDLVITVDTAVAHLAGAMGKPTWVLLPRVPDWRWQLNRPDSPWYPTLRLFRQDETERWEPVVARVVAELAALGQQAAQTAGTTVPKPDRAVLNGACRRFRQGDPAGAREGLAAYLDRHPRDADALNLIAAVDFSEGRLTEALGHAAAAVAAAPASDQFRVNRGRILAAMGRPGEAVSDIEAVLRRHPRHREAALALADVLEDADRRDAAIAPLAALLAATPGDAAVRIRLSRCLRRSGRPGAAVRLCREALALSPDVRDLRAALGLALAADGKALEAEALFADLAAECPDDAEALHNLGVIRLCAGRLAEAAAAFEATLARHPDHTDARFNLAQLHLLEGRFAEGWQGYRWRRKKPAWRRRYPLRPEGQWWEGRGFAGERLCVRCEQGIGDALQFVRYLPMVKARGGTVVLEAPPALHRLLQEAPGIDRLAVPAPDRQPPEDCGLAVPIMSLPRIFGTREDTIPAGIPYIRPPAQAVAAWAGRVPSGRRPIVGLVWAGNPDHANDAHRSIPLAALTPALAVSGVRWVGLQCGARAREAAGLPVELRFENLGGEFQDFADTAGCLAHLDLVVTVDTAVAHLAGAMGKPAWVLLPRVPDWRWMLDRQDSPWYPTLRLLRQERPGDWRGPVSRVAADLGDLLAAARRRS